MIGRITCSVAALGLLAPPSIGQPQPGLVWVMFHDTALQRPAGHGVDARLDLTLTGYHDCSRLWLGSLVSPVGGDIVLLAEAAQGVRVYLGGACVIDGWGPDKARQGPWRAPAGQRVALRVEWYHLGGEAHLRLFWSSAGRPAELIPPEAFAHDEADAAHVAAIAAGEEVVMVGNRGPAPAPRYDFPPAPAGDEENKAGIYEPGVGREPGPVRLGPGPHLLLDDRLVEYASGVVRRVERPQRDPAIPNPLVTGAEDHCFQPYLTVLREPSGRFRIYYGSYGDDRDPIVSHISTLESDDGIHWRRPARVLTDPAPIQFGNSVVDRGPEAPDPARRYALAWYFGGGMMLATSADGLDWNLLAPYPVVRHNHDIVNLCWDPLRARYVATISVYTTGAGWTGTRRVTMQTASTDLQRWSKPHYILTPTVGDDGETQFYAMNGHLFRGELWIGLVKVLRDDLRADGVPDDAFGVGYTTLAWSRDGEHWVRDREPFFEPDPTPGAWDHAHAWIDYQLPVGEQVYLYYGGYRTGHKANRFEERQIGLVRMTRDRYVAREATAEGRLRTPLVVIEGDRLSVNAAVRGELRVRLLDADGSPLPGYDWADVAPITGDATAHPVRFARPLAAVRGRPLRLEFGFRAARLYGIDVL